MSHFKPCPRRPAVPNPRMSPRSRSCGPRSMPGELVHLEHIPGRAGQTTSWPQSIRSEVTAALAASGIEAPWTHQAQAAGLARAGQNVIIATRAASGKSAGYLAAALSEVLDGGTVLYIAPTKALAADQLQSVRALGVPGVRATCYDGDSTFADRAWAQAHANYLLTNPDMLHSALLPNHTRWRGFFKRLRVVIIDECHDYRGVFGSHVAQVLRRLRRVAAQHKPEDGQMAPVFVLASATIAEPAAGARLLTGLDVVAVTEDGSPRVAAHVRAVGTAADVHATATSGPAARPPGRRRTCWPRWSGRRCPRWPSSGPGAARRPSRSPPATALGRDHRQRGRRVPVRLPGRRPPRPGGRAARRADHRHGRHHRARTRHQHPRPRRGAHRRLAGHLVVAVAAGGPGRPRRAARHGGVHRPRRPARHATWSTTRTRCCTIRSSPAVLDPANPYVLGAAPGRGRRRAPADRAGPRAVRPRRRGGRHRPDRGGRAAEAAVRLALRPPGPPGQARSASAASRAGRCGWSRRRRAAWSGRWTSRPRTGSSTTAPSTCTRARATWSASWTLTTGWRWWSAGDPGYTTQARDVTDIDVIAGASSRALGRS